MTRKRSKIFLYQDYFNNAGVLHRRLDETYGHENVFLCDADDILNGILNEDVFLFVMPGGADLNYREKLEGDCNRNIRSFVEAGGHYLGICAGAYYASREIEWARDEMQPIIGARELRFFNGTAMGPLYEFLENNDFDKSWQNIVEVRIDNHIYPTFYYGGPSFAGDGFGFYMSNNKTAIVKEKIGDGTVILSGPHIEYRPNDLIKRIYKRVDKSPNWTAKNHAQFQKSYSPDNDIWSKVLKEFE